MANDHSHSWSLLRFGMDMICRTIECMQETKVVSNKNQSLFQNELYFHGLPCHSLITQESQSWEYFDVVQLPPPWSIDSSKLWQENTVAGIHTAQACTPSRKTDRTSKHNEIHQHIIISYIAESLSSMTKIPVKNRRLISGRVSATSLWRFKIRSCSPWGFPHRFSPSAGVLADIVSGSTWRLFQKVRLIDFKIYASIHPILIRQLTKLQTNCYAFFHASVFQLSKSDLAKYD